MKTTLLQEALGPLEAVLRVLMAEDVPPGYYLRIGGTLYSTRLAGTPDGPALWQLDELPALAEADAAAAALLGRDVRRVLLADCAEDDTQMALVLDLGQQNYLEFYEVGDDLPAQLMHLSPDCGRVAREMTLSATLPLTVKVPEGQVRVLRMGVKVLFFGIALIVAGFISLLAGVNETQGGAVTLCGFVLVGLGRYLSARNIVCPWCGEKKMRLAYGSSYLSCNHCNNGIDLGDRRKNIC